MTAIATPATRLARLQSSFDFSAMDEHVFTLAGKPLLQECNCFVVLSLTSITLLAKKSNHKDEFDRSFQKPERRRHAKVKDRRPANRKRTEGYLCLSEVRSSLLRKNQKSNLQLFSLFRVFVRRGNSRQFTAKVRLPAQPQPQPPQPQLQLELLSQIALQSEPQRMHTHLQLLALTFPRLTWPKLG